MLEQLFTGMAQVIQLSSILLTIGAGIVGGFFCAFVAPPHTMFAFRWYVIHTSTMITTLFGIFWVARIAYAILSADPLWGRVVGAFVLTVLFSVIVGMGVWVGLKLRTRKWVK